MKLRPLNRTLVLKMDPIVKYEGTLFLPDKNSEEKISTKGEIVSWGSRCKGTYKQGQRVLLPSVNSMYFFKPYWYKVNGETYRLIQEHEIIAIIED